MSCKDTVIFALEVKICFYYFNSHQKRGLEVCREKGLIVVYLLEDMSGELRRDNPDEIDQAEQRRPQN